MYFFQTSPWSDDRRYPGLKSHSFCPNSKVPLTQWLTHKNDRSQKYKAAGATKNWHHEFVHMGLTLPAHTTFTIWLSHVFATSMFILEFRAFGSWTLVKIRVRWKWGPIILRSAGQIFSQEKVRLARVTSDPSTFLIFWHVTLPPQLCGQLFRVPKASWRNKDWLANPFTILARLDKY